MQIIAGEWVFVVLAKNLGYENLEEFFIYVFDNLARANMEVVKINANPKKEFIMLKQKKIER